MTEVSLRTLLDDAAERGYGIPAFNVNTLDQCHAVMHAAKAENAPAIIQATSQTLHFFGEIVFSHVVRGLKQSYPEIPLCVHLDHGLDKAACRSAIFGGFTSVMMDGSLTPDLKMPSIFEENIGITSEVVQIARAHGVSVEGALGVVGSLASCMGVSEEGVTTARALTLEELVTEPMQAREFVQRTGVDALAVSIGTTHGLSKFENPPDDSRLDLGLLAEIHDAIPNTHLVLHGCSSLPPELQHQVNRAGGQISPAWGVPIPFLQKAIGLGVRKINIDSDNRLAMTAGVREFLDRSRADVDPRAYLRAGMSRMTELCRQRYRQFGAAGMATRILRKSSRRQTP